MTNKEAYERLELPEGADLQEVRRKFAELYNDYQMRIDNAPMARMRQTYEQHLEAVKEAYAVLNGSEGIDDTGDLPRTGQSGAFEAFADPTGGGSVGKETDELPEVKEGYQNAIRKAEAAKTLLIHWITERHAEEMRQKKNEDPTALPPGTDDVKPLSKSTRKPIVWYGLFGILAAAAIWYFVLPSEKGDAIAAVVDAPARASKDSAAWQIAVATSAYEQYLKQYPQGVFHSAAADSIARLNEIEEEAAKPEVITQQTQQVVPTNTSWRDSYDHVHSFYEGLAKVELSGKYGFVDKQGNVVVPIKYDDDSFHIIKFENGRALAILNKKYGYVDKHGKEIVPLKYDGASFFREGLAAVELSGKHGFVDKQGNEVIPLKYDDVWFFSEGLARVSLNGKIGYVNKQGNEVILPKYDIAGYFKEGLAMVKLNGKYGYIDKRGNEVIPLIYDDVAHEFYEDLAEVTLNGKTFKINRRGGGVENSTEDK